MFGMLSAHGTSPALICWLHVVSGCDEHATSQVFPEENTHLIRSFKGKVTHQPHARANVSQRKPHCGDSIWGSQMLGNIANARQFYCLNFVSPIKVFIPGHSKDMYWMLLIYFKILNGEFPWNSVKSLFKTINMQHLECHAWERRTDLWLDGIWVQLGPSREYGRILFHDSCVGVPCVHTLSYRAQQPSWLLYTQSTPVCRSRSWISAILFELNTMKWRSLHNVTIYYHWSTITMGGWYYFVQSCVLFSFCFWSW